MNIEIIDRTSGQHKQMFLSRQVKKPTFYDTEPKAIPIPLLLEAIQKCEYGDVLGLALQFRFMTGCRGKELDKIDPNKQSNGFIFWQLGKNQTKQYRKEYIGVKWWEEYDHYRHKQGVPRNKLFHINNETLRTYFCKQLRPKLSSAWQEKIPVMRSGEIRYEFRYTWGGLRKTFQTLLFATLWERYKDSGVALEMTSKRMKHSSKGITAKHYIENAENIEAKAYIGLLPADLVNQPRQENLFEFYC